MAVYAVPPDTPAITITGQDLELVRYAAETTQRWRHRNHQPPARALDQLLAIIDAVSPRGHGDMPEDPAVHADYVSTSDAAALLRRSPRTVRRMAPLLGGQMIGGRLMVDRLAVLEHLEGATSP